MNLPRCICRLVNSLLIVCLLVMSGLAQASQTQAPPTKKPPATAKPAAQTAPAQTKLAADKSDDEVIPPAGSDAMFPTIVARVNDKPISGRDLEQRIQTQLAPIGNPKWSNLKEDYRQQLISEALGALIGAELIYQKAVSLDLRATDAEAQAEFQRFSKSYSSDAEVNLALADRGLDRAAFMRELKRSLTVTKYITEHVAKKIGVTPAEVSEYYSKHPEEFDHPEMFRTSHILIRVADGATEEQEKIARQRAEAVLARVRKGEDFAKLAKEYSTDPSAAQGGDLGITPKGQLPPVYEDAALALQVGKVSDVVRSQFGYHIIKLTELKKAGKSSLAEVQQQLTDFLKSQKSDDELNKVVAQLRSAAKILAYISINGEAPGSPIKASSPRP